MVKAIQGSSVQLPVIQLSQNESCLSGIIAKIITWFSKFINALNCWSKKKTAETPPTTTTPIATPVRHLPNPGAGNQLPPAGNGNQQPLVADQLPPAGNQVPPNNNPPAPIDAPQAVNNPMNALPPALAIPIPQNELDNIARMDLDAMNREIVRLDAWLVQARADIEQNQFMIGVQEIHFQAENHAEEAEEQMKVYLEDARLTLLRMRVADVQGFDAVYQRLTEANRAHEAELQAVVIPDDVLRGFPQEPRELDYQINGRKINMGRLFGELIQVVPAERRRVQNDLNMQIAVLRVLRERRAALDQVPPAVDQQPVNNANNNPLAIHPVDDDAPRLVPVDPNDRRPAREPDFINGQPHIPNQVNPGPEAPGAQPVIANQQQPAQPGRIVPGGNARPPAAPRQAPGILDRVGQAWGGFMNRARQALGGPAPQPGNNQPARGRQAPQPAINPPAPQVNNPPAAGRPVVTVQQLVQWYLALNPAHQEQAQIDLMTGRPAWAAQIIQGIRDGGGRVFPLAEQLLANPEALQLMGQLEDNHDDVALQQLQARYPQIIQGMRMRLVVPNQEVANQINQFYGRNPQQFDPQNAQMMAAVAANPQMREQMAQIALANPQQQQQLIMQFLAQHPEMRQFVPNPNAAAANQQPALPPRGPAPRAAQPGQPGGGPDARFAQIMAQHPELMPLVMQIQVAGPEQRQQLEMQLGLQIAAQHPEVFQMFAADQQAAPALPPAQPAPLAQFAANQQPAPPLPPRGPAPLAQQPALPEQQLPQLGGIGDRMNQDPHAIPLRGPAQDPEIQQQLMDIGDAIDPEMQEQLANALLEQHPELADQVMVMMQARQRIAGQAPIVAQGAQGQAIQPGPAVPAANLNIRDAFLAGRARQAQNPQPRPRVPAPVAGAPRIDGNGNIVR